MIVDRNRRRPGAAIALVAAGAMLSACGQSNTYVAPPAPKVVVAKPVEQKVTRYFEGTGNAAAINSANLVARVSGFLTEVAYQDGMPVKKGAHLFTIEPEPYELKLQQSQAAEAGAQAALTQAQADFDRQQELVARQAVSKATLDTSTANRDSAKSKLLQSQADTKQAQINLDYTRVVAPFDGIVTARQVSVGELVGGSGAQVLATIVQLDPIHVNFSASERDVLRVRDMLVKRGLNAGDLLGTEVDVALQTDQGFPHKGKLNYVAPTVDPGTGTLAARAELANPTRLLLPGFFVRVRVPLEETPALLVPTVALGSRPGRPLRADGRWRECRAATQGHRRPCCRRNDRGRRRAEGGRARDRQRPAARHPRPEGRPADADCGQVTDRPR